MVTPLPSTTTSTSTTTVSSRIYSYTTTEKIEPERINVKFQKAGFVAGNNEQYVKNHRYELYSHAFLQKGVCYGVMNVASLWHEDIILITSHTILDKFMYLILQIYCMNTKAIRRYIYQ